MTGVQIRIHKRDLLRALSDVYVTLQRMMEEASEQRFTPMQAAQARVAVLRAIYFIEGVIADEAAA
jgi:hypothetical protein